MLLHYYLVRVMLTNILREFFSLNKTLHLLNCFCSYNNLCVFAFVFVLVEEFGKGLEISVVQIFDDILL